MIALTKSAKDVLVGDLLLTRDGPRTVKQKSFGDMYVSDGFWFNAQEGGTYAWKSPDVRVDADDLVVVYG